MQNGLKHILIAIVVIYSIIIGAYIGITNNQAKSDCAKSSQSTETCEFYIR